MERMFGTARAAEAAHAAFIRAEEFAAGPQNRSMLDDDTVRDVIMALNPGLRLGMGQSLVPDFYRE